MKKPALLVADDDPQVLAAMRKDLRPKYGSSYTILSAASGEEAVAAMRELKARGDSLAMNTRPTLDTREAAPRHGDPRVTGEEKLSYET